MNQVLASGKGPSKLPNPKIVGHGPLEKKEHQSEHSVYQTMFTNLSMVATRRAILTIQKA